MRRYVTPADINGTGQVLRQWNGNYSGNAASDLGGDQWGRVSSTASSGRRVYPAGCDPTGRGTSRDQLSVDDGAAYPYPMVDTRSPLPTTRPTVIRSTAWSPQISQPELYSRVQAPKRRGRPLTRTPRTWCSSRARCQPTTPGQRQGELRRPQRGRRDEPVCAQPAARLTVRPADLEWLYRQHDVDGSPCRPLGQPAPISFTNTVDGLRRGGSSRSIAGNSTISSGPTTIPGTRFRTTAISR